MRMQIGVDSFAAVGNGAVTAVERMQGLVEEIVLADEVGLDAFGVGEHHRAEFLDSAPAMILAAAASRTKQITADQCGDGAERGGPGAGVSGVCDAGSDCRTGGRRSWRGAARSSRASRCSG